jgi:uncharacterized repeat protein (TIGR01451 family)
MADASLTYTASPSSVESGKTITLTITAKNTGTSNLINAYVVAYLPENLVVTSTNPSVYYKYTDPSSGTYGFLFGDLVPDEVKTAEITAKVDASAGDVLNTFAFLFEPIQNGTRQIANISVSVTVIPPSLPPSVNVGNSNNQNSCTEDWTCTDFAQCVNGKQTRTCSDKNNCGTSANKPAESKDCTIEAAPFQQSDTEQSQPLGMAGMIAATITSNVFVVLLLLIAVIILLAVLRFKLVSKAKEKITENENTNKNETVPDETAS